MPLLSVSYAFLSIKCALFVVYRRLFSPSSDRYKPRVLGFIWYPYARV